MILPMVEVQGAQYQVPNLSQEWCAVLLMLKDKSAPNYMTMVFTYVGKLIKHSLKIYIYP